METSSSGLAFPNLTITNFNRIDISKLSSINWTEEHMINMLNDTGQLTQIEYDNMTEGEKNVWSH